MKRRSALLLVFVAAFFGGFMVGPANADAHRWTEAVATRQITKFIAAHQCGTSVKWGCWQITPPIPVPYGSHSWRWNGPYYWEDFGATIRNCRTWGIIVSHDIRDSTGKLLRKGNTVYNWGHAC